MGFNGANSESRLEKGSKCPKCRKAGIYYTGSSVLHGNPYTPAADTEVEHHYSCPHCQHNWSAYC